MSATSLFSQIQYANLFWSSSEEHLWQSSWPSLSPTLVNLTDLSFYPPSSCSLLYSSPPHPKQADTPCIPTSHACQKTRHYACRSSLLLSFTRSNTPVSFPALQNNTCESSPRAPALVHPKDLPLLTSFSWLITLTRPINIAEHPTTTQTTPAKKESRLSTDLPISFCFSRLSPLQSHLQHYSRPSVMTSLHCITSFQESDLLPPVNSPRYLAFPDSYMSVPNTLKYTLLRTPSVHSWQEQRKFCIRQHKDSMLSEKSRNQEPKHPPNKEKSRNQHLSL